MTTAGRSGWCCWIAAHASSHAATSALAVASVAATGWSIPVGRSEEHTSELQSLMRISYAVFCLKKQLQLYPYCVHRVLTYNITLIFFSSFISIHHSLSSLYKNTF